MRRRDADVTYGGAGEKLFYELKPIIWTMFAIYALRSSQADLVYVKLNALILIGATVYITYSRLVHRGAFR